VQPGGPDAGRLAARRRPVRQPDRGRPLLAHLTVASQAVRSVKAVAEAGIPVYFAGSSFSSQFFRQNTPGIPLDKTLREAADLIALRHSAPSHEPATVPRERAGSQPAPSPDPGARAPAPHRPRNVGEPTYGRQRPGAPRSSVTRRWVGRVRAT